MTFKLRFSIGILFSLSLHVFLINIFISWYPGIIKNEDWELGNLFHFSNKEIFTSIERSKTKKKKSEKILSKKIYFPDILLIKNKKKIKVAKKKHSSQLSVKSILEQVEKFPKSIKSMGVSNNKLSGQVGELLSLITPFTLKSSFTGKEGFNLTVGELGKFRHELNQFLSERWEVPINLIESKYTALVQFKIKKSGHLISWEIEESANPVLKKTLENLLKNLQFLPSLPESYSRDSYKFGVKFSPSNLK